MTLIFRANLGIIKIHTCAIFHEPEIIGLGLRGLNTFCVRALEKEKKIKNKKQKRNSVKLYKAVLKHLPNDKTFRAGADNSAVCLTDRS